jgi:hypothetical protein
MKKFRQIPDSIAPAFSSPVAISSDRNKAIAASLLCENKGKSNT